MRLPRLLVTVLAFAISWALPAMAEEGAPEAGFGNWAVGILAADWRDSQGKPIEAFENARVALTTAFESVGFKAENIAALSLRPNATNGRALASDIAFASIAAKAKTAQDGCLLYFTSHGSPDGMVLGREGLLPPARLNSLVDQWCGERPTVVVVSACYSGVFVPALSRANRMVLTAARPDRSSFGCHADADYPYFDACILESLPAADDFVDLASRTRRCVAWREYQEGLAPASEPQVEVGADVEDLFIFQNFEHAPP
jgi:hypothetical protein